MRTRVILNRIAIVWIPFSSGMCSLLKSAISGFKPLKRIQELQARLAHQVRLCPKLLGMLDGEFDAVHGNARLVSHLEFHWCGPSL